MSQYVRDDLRCRSHTHTQLTRARRLAVAAHTGAPMHRTPPRGSPVPHPRTDPKLLSTQLQLALSVEAWLSCFCAVCACACVRASRCASASCCESPHHRARMHERYVPGALMCFAATLRFLLGPKCQALPRISALYLNPFARTRSHEGNTIYAGCARVVLFPRPHLLQPIIHTIRTVCNSLHSVHEYIPIPCKSL